MFEKRLFMELEGQVVSAKVHKKRAEDVIDPAIRKIQQRNHKVKLSLAKTLLALGLKPECVETILCIHLPSSKAGI